MLVAIRVYVPSSLAVSGSPCGLLRTVPGSPVRPLFQGVPSLLHASGDQCTFATPRFGRPVHVRYSTPRATSARSLLHVSGDRTFSISLRAMDHGWVHRLLWR